ncbi:MAG: aminomethyl-transferring glycine dehydrogenase subunit GcvPB [Candidatus Thorarchaeota archaeon]|nr:aminomethyl-transferring glycine dehydrogenase subunit GcvPB [Candidatus Thorarchaeota archaeon]
MNSKITDSRYRQAYWDEPIIFEMSTPGVIGHAFPAIDAETRRVVGDATKTIPDALKRKHTPNLPEVSEPAVVRHFTRLSQMNFSVTQGTYPLGSCTMKYNPIVNDFSASQSGFAWLHPYQDVSQVQGSLELMWELEKWLAEITGMSEVTLQPSAGAQGEFTGVLVIRAYHKCITDECEQRTEIIIPDAAHGTNPASAAMAGYRIVVIPSDKDGLVDIDAVKAAAGPKTAGLMLTNPNTIGVFEKNIEEIAGIVHDSGGLLYYDGANFNAIMGITRPGDMGFDVVHLNLHKTFSTPHGGGGPGAGPVGVTKELAEFLPVPRVRRDENDVFCLDYNLPRSIGRVQSFYGNFGVLVRAYAYTYALGKQGLKKSSEIAVLNANYVAHHIRKIPGFTLPYSQDDPRMHECVISAEELKDETGVTAMDVAKRLLDFGIHSPTVYFPLIVPEAMMIEPTESESKQEIDAMIAIYEQISKEAHETPEVVTRAPHSTALRELDGHYAAHPKTVTLSWRIQNQREEK